MKRLARSVRCVAPVDALLGEGPLFDPRIGRLLFLDIKGEKIFVFDPATQATRMIDIKGNISALGLAAKGGYICARREGFALLRIDAAGAHLDSIASPPKEMPDHRFNDGKVDPFGGFWAGTMDDKEVDRSAGAWWRLAPCGGVVKLADGFHVTNGPAFDQPRDRVYFTDSGRQTIFVARATPDGFEKRETFLSFAQGDGYPDGMDVDRDGYLWVAFWDGAAVRRFSPDGQLVEEIAMPVMRPTSVALVGAVAYVTSARIGLSTEDCRLRPQSGGLFEIALAADVSPEPRYYGA